jgi:hypothetical protein
VIELTISQRLVNLILNYAYGHAIVVEFKIGPYLNVTELQITVESHINESHIKDKSHINDVQAAYQLLLYVLESSHIKDKSHINDVFAADGQHR